MAGDPELGQRFLDLLAEAVWDRPFTDEHEREIRRMKARIERERIPPGEDPEFHLKLGRGSLSDVEWTVQLLQLRTGIRAPSTMGALDALEADGAVAAADAEVLRAAYRFCEHARNRWWLVGLGAGRSPTRCPHAPTTCCTWPDRWARRRATCARTTAGSPAAPAGWSSGCSTARGDPTRFGVARVTAACDDDAHVSERWRERCRSRPRSSRSST